MGRPKGSVTKNQRKWTVAEKLEIVQLHLKDHKGYQWLETQFQVNRGMIHVWVQRYLKHGEAGLEPKNRRIPNPLMSLYKKKSLFEVEMIQLENFKLRIENERLKKGYLVKGVGTKKEYVRISKESMKS